MAKYLVETYYTCSFKVKHYLDNLNEKELDKLEQRDDGKFEILDVKLDNRKTKNLDKISKNVSEENIEELRPENQDDKKIISQENNLKILTLLTKFLRTLIEDLVCQIEEKATFKKQV